MQSRYKGLPDPPGFSEAQIAKVSTFQRQYSRRTDTLTQKKTTSIAHSASAADSYAKLKQKRAWDAAISPGKSLPMNAFMLYMSGGGVQIFSIGILAMLLINPIKAFGTINSGEWSDT